MQLLTGLMAHWLPMLTHQQLLLVSLITFMLSGSKDKAVSAQRLIASGHW
jgi:hypothetical protein